MILFVLTAFIIACQPYALERSTITPLPKKFFNAEQACNRISSVRHFPRRIRRSELTLFYRPISDTNAFYHSDKAPWLFINGCYDKKAQCGYFIAAEARDSNRTLSYACVLLKVEKGVLKMDEYFFSEAVANLQEAKPYLVTENTVLFRGRTGTKKELRRMHRSVKRNAGKKEGQ